MLFLPLEGETLLHRMDERLLFASYLLYQLLLVFATAGPLLLAFALLTVVSGHLGVTVRRFLRSTRRLLLLLAVLASVPPVTALLAGGSLLVPLEGSLLLLLRLTALLLSAHLMLGVLSPGGVSKVLRWSTAPFGGAGRTLSTIIVALFALLPRLEEILEEESLARRLRGPGLRGPLRRTRTALYSLLREGVLEAESLTDAFLLRGFHLFDLRESMSFRSARGEWWPPLLLLLCLAVTALWRFYAV
ncbi:MAG: hypothetical protein ACOC25_08075 [Alkalispirochaetaceae bacterium]